MASSVDMLNSDSQPPDDSDHIENGEQPYAQTKRASEFSSENHKLEIANLPNRSTYHVVRQLLERQFKLSPHKIRIGSGKAFVAFTSQEARDEAIARIHNQEWKGRVLIARPASARDDPLIKRFNAESRTRGEEDLTNESQPITQDAINTKVCPLWDKSYEDQLKIKESLMRSILNMSKQIFKLNPRLQREAPNLYAWVQKNNKLCCHFDGIEPSPIKFGYRNKCEFNIGQDGTLGFRMGRYKDGSERVVEPPENCPIVNEIMLALLKIIQPHFKDQNRTKLKGFNHVTHDGHLRQLTIRTNQISDSLVIVDMHPQDLTEEEIESEIEKIVELLKTNPHVVSIFFNVSEKSHLSSVEQTLRLVYGQNHLIEHLAIDLESPLKFRIGPTSFFQVNTKAAEILYRSIIDLADLNSKSLVLDVGCGTGTISLSLARRVHFVIGIEVVESAIADAKINAKENDITNVAFFTGKAEDLINESISILRGKLLDQDNQGDIVAIVDPPRTGFNNSFVKSLRASIIKKIIYVACDPKANTNLISLCRPTSKAYQGDPFVPIRAKAFDLFPHTKFCELVLVYERLTAKDREASPAGLVAEQG